MKKAPYGASLDVSSGLLRGYLNTGHDHMEAQAPEFLIITVNLTGKIKELPARCILSDENIKPSGPCKSLTKSSKDVVYENAEVVH